MKNKKNANANALDNKIRLVNKRIETILKNLGDENILFQKYQGMIGALFSENDTTIKINNSNYIKISRGRAINNINHNELDKRLDAILKLPTYADEKKRIKEKIKSGNEDKIRILASANQQNNSKKSKKMKLPKITQQDIIDFAKTEYDHQNAVDAALEILYNYEDTVFEAAQAIGIMRQRGKGVRTNDEIDQVLEVATHIEKYREKAKNKNGGKLLPEPDYYFISHPGDYSAGGYFDLLEYANDDTLPPDRND